MPVLSAARQRVTSLNVAQNPIKATAELHATSPCTYTKPTGGHFLLFFCWIAVIIVQSHRVSACPQLPIPVLLTSIVPQDVHKETCSWEEIRSCKCVTAQATLLMPATSPRRELAFMTTCGSLSASCWGRRNGAGQLQRSPLTSTPTFCVAGFPGPLVGLRVRAPSGTPRPPTCTPLCVAFSVAGLQHTWLMSSFGWLSAPLVDVQLGLALSPPA
eukprot:365307-Chlamydomonas_euryale.AAC.10